MATAKKAPVKKAVVKKAAVKKAAVKKAAVKKVAAAKLSTTPTSDKFAFPLSFEEEISKPFSHRAATSEPMTGKVIPRSFVGQLESAHFGKIDNARKRNSTRSGKYGLVLAFLATAILSAGLTYFVLKPAPVQTSGLTTAQARISGGVLLSEVELKAAVKKLGRTVFWAGPMKGAKYTLNASDVKQIYVRYLPGGKGIEDTKRNYRVIATYVVPGAYASTAAAGNQSNGVTLSRADGGVVYYNKLEPTNVYLANKDSDFQIEVFDPEPATSLQLATTLKTVIPIL